eukprot:CAMPEP_0113610428 /NCGR_PEP_ID=MMETSP0017_2-20120614/5026_1 /TAXON_ID=2856 /ORGANISM="Cylindrotheca closterium" /LENGTH=436 /DNA_ID=CAMNT_0000519325 /DNA_START=67 /DNA_END=1374 /DNA_ORIENTATION=- /assembly_acc=CAM_ASM_000147
MAKKKSSSKGKERPPEVDKLLKPAVVVALGLILFQFFKGINSEVIRINVADEMELREVFFGEGEGKNYAVLCHPEDAKYPVSSVFQDASSDSSAPAEFRLLDCNHVLSSEKSVFDRFKLNKKQRPTVFVSGKIGEPKQVPAKHLKTGSMLVKALKNLLVPKAEKVETTQDLRSKCLDKDVCALLLKGGKVSPNYVKDAMSKLLVEFPKVAFAAVDTSVLYVKGIEAEYLPEFSSGQPRFVVFKKVTGGTGKNDGRLKTSLATLPGHGVGYGPMSNLIGDVVSNKAEMKKVPTLPTMKTRTKKLEQEERAKRERRSDQQKRQDSGSGSSTPGGAFQTNDGTKEGRKAERDRRRAEHRKNNPDYKEKTPEEIAEIERRRRQRMEEESAKWNMAPEDMPEEGEPVGDEGSMYDEEDGDYYDMVYEDEEEEEDEDVLDLD